MAPRKRPELKTQADVANLSVFGASYSETVYFDRGKDRVRGLGLRVRRATTIRTWVFFYRWAGKQHRLVIGEAGYVGALTLDDARVEASRWRRVLRENRNPVEVQRIERSAAQAAKPAAATFKALKNDYLASRRRDMKPRSHEEITRHLEHHWKPLHEQDAKAIDKVAVASRLNEIEQENGPVARNRARSTLSALFAWAIEEGRADTNPVEGTRKVGETARERVLTNAELVAIWNGIDDATDYGKIVRLLMLTGQRREEIGGIQWPEIATDAQGRKLIALPGERTKNGRAHDVPLSAEAAAIIEGTHKTQGRPLVFGSGEGGYSGWSRSKGRLDESLGLAEWTLHDLRRTMATRMADSPDDGGLGIQPHIIEAVLNHVSGHKAGVAGIYNRSTYAAEKRAALEAWGKYLATIVAQASGANVVRLGALRQSN